MKTPTANPSPPAGPARVMAAFLAQKARFLAAMRDEGGLFELRFLARLLARLRARLGLAGSQADVIESRLREIRSRIRREIGPKDDTPGILDTAECRVVLRELDTLGRASRTHVHTIQSL